MRVLELADFSLLGSLSSLLARHWAIFVNSGSRSKMTLSNRKLLLLFFVFVCFFSGLLHPPHREASGRMDGVGTAGACLVLISVKVWVCAFWMQMRSCSCVVQSGCTRRATAEHSAEIIQGTAEPLGVEEQNRYVCEDVRAMKAVLQKQMHSWMHICLSKTSHTHPRWLLLPLHWCHLAHL